MGMIEAADASVTGDSLKGAGTYSAGPANVNAGEHAASARVAQISWRSETDGQTDGPHPIVAIERTRILEIVVRQLELVERIVHEERSLAEDRVQAVLEACAHEVAVARQPVELGVHAIRAHPGVVQTRSAERLEVVAERHAQLDR